MLNRNPDKEWEKFGKDDPYYGVMVLDKFHKQDLDRQALDEFFASGRAHVEYVMRTIQTCFGAEFAPARVLDFGCGVGRCVVPMARLFPSVVGVDVSSSMLEEAKKNCREQSLDNVAFHRSDDALSTVPGSFDLIHSTFTLQHIPRKRGEKIFARLVERLSDNGVGAIDVLIHRNLPRLATTVGALRRNVPLVNNVANLLHGKPFGEPLMEKVVYDLNRLVTILQDSGGGNVHLRVFRNGNQRDAMLFFQKKREAATPHETFFNTP